MRLTLLSQSFAQLFSPELGPVRNKIPAAVDKQQDYSF